MYLNLLKTFPILVCTVILLLCYLAYSIRWLTLSGSVAAFLMALVLAYGGIQMFYVPVVLFVGGTLLSKLNREEKGKNGRNAIQVLANGGIGIFCLLYFYLYPLDRYEYFAFTAFFISFSISVCDTFSSETGKFFNGMTVDILSIKPVQKGLSGGISIKGTTGGMIGVSICSLIAYFFLGFSIHTSFHVVVFGFSGMLLDSVLGSALQAKYVNAKGETEEDEKNDNQLKSGYAWCNNDVVNVLSNLIVVALFICLKMTGLI